jgi:zinc transporter
MPQHGSATAAGRDPAQAMAAPARGEPPVMAEAIPGLVWGYRFVGGNVTPIADQTEVAPHTGEWLWLHFNLADMRAITWLSSSQLLPKPDLDFLLSKNDVQQLLPTASCIVGVFFDLAHGFSREDSEFGHLRFVMTKRLFVTGRRHPLSSVEMVRQQVESGRRFDSPVSLFNALVDQVGQSIDNLIDELSDEIDLIEDMILKDALTDDRQRLGRARLMSVRIHRRVNGLRGIFRRLDDEEEGEQIESLRAAGRRLAQRLDELDRDVIELRDRARLLQDELSVRLAEQTNRQLRILSILTALLLPPSLIAGLFGMNVSDLPFSRSSTGFWWALALTIVASAIALWAMKRAGVLK